MKTLILVVLSCVGLAGCSGTTFELGEAQPIESPAGPGSQTPNLAVGLDGNLYLSWTVAVENGHELRFSKWSDDSWSEPKTIARGDDWFVNWADFPSMAVLADGTLAAHWLVKSGGATYAYDVVLALSQDAGTTWSEPFRPHRDGTQTEHGFVSLVPTEQGSFDVIWLDGRHTAETPRGAMTLRYASLLPDGRLVDDGVVDDKVCDCCSTDAIRTGDGTILAAYRDRTDGEIRDISVSSRDAQGWSAPRGIYADKWEMAACPVNGPALAGRGDRIAAAWFTAARDTPVVQVAFSRNGGQNFGRPVRVDNGAPLGRVDVVLLDDDTAVVSWLEREAGRAQILVRRVTQLEAFESTPVVSTSEARSSGFPRLVRFGDRIVMTWTETGEPSRVATAAIPIETR